MGGRFGGMVGQDAVENPQSILSELPVSGNQTEVCILPRGRFVVVAGSDLGDKLHLIALLAGDDQQLGMHLILSKPIGQIDPRFLQPPGPDDIIFLIEPGAQFNDDMDLLAVFSGLDECRHHLALTRNPIEGHLDAQDTFVRSRLEKQVNKRLHRFEGIGQQHIMILDLRHDRLAMLEHDALLGSERRVEQLLFPTALIPGTERKTE